MEGKPKNGKRKRVSFRYDPRIFSRLESIYSGSDGEPLKQITFHGNEQLMETPSFVLCGYAQEAQRKPVLIRGGHVLVCGMPQLSGKTTFVEGLLSRWPGNEHKKKKIIAFISKQEALFSGFRRIKPYINTNPDPDFLSLVVESILVVNRRPQVSRKINLIMVELCHNAKSLKHVLKNATRMQKKVKYRDKLKHDVCIVLKYYLDEIFPQCLEAGFVQSVEFNEINNNVVIDLSQSSQEIQTLVVGSIAHEILNHHKETILVIPDGWTLFDDYYSAGRFHVESLIEHGSQNRNYIIIESVDIEHIPLHIRRQMSTILLGYQSYGEEARVEIRALRDLASRMLRSRTMKAVEKPFLTRFNIQKLKIGEFYAFPSYIEEMSVWRVNKISTISPQTNKPLHF